MKSIQEYYEKADFRMSDLRTGDEVTAEDLNDIGFALTIMWKDYCEKENMIELNEDNQKKVNLLNDRIPKYLDFISNNVNDLELSKVLMDEFENLFEVIRK